MDDVDGEDVEEIAGMLRGLACALDGFNAVTGMDNERFWTESPVKWSFSSPEKAALFVDRVKYYFSPEILSDLKVKRRYRRG